jgi:hypothetical protein
MQLENLSADDDRMTGIVTPGVTSHHICFTSQPIGNAALALVTPLRADQNCCRHEFFTP